jgi:DNA-binding TFAR19-related protein (PDSD5 family)
MLRRVALVRTDVSENISVSFVKMTRIGELGTTLAVSSLILVTLIKEALSSSETLVLTRPTRRNIPKDDIIRSHRRENLKSYIALTDWALERRRNVSPVRYELGVYIPEDHILHSLP